MMSYPFSSLFPVLAFSIAFTLIYASVPLPILRQVCGVTQEPQYCVKTLGEDPRAANGSLQELGHISIKLALARALSIPKYLDGLVAGSESDPVLAAKYKSCIKDDKFVIAKLEEIDSFSDDWMAWERVGAAEDVVELITKSLNRYMIPPSADSKFITVSLNVETLVQAFRAIVIMVN